MGDRARRLTYLALPDRRTVRAGRRMPSLTTGSSSAWHHIARRCRRPAMGPVAQTLDLRGFRRMAVTNHERVGKALTLVRDSVRPEVETDLAGLGTGCGGWMQRVNDRLHHQDRVRQPRRSGLPPQGHGRHLGSVLPRHPLAVHPELPTLCCGMLATGWAHNQRFSSEETLRILDHCEMMLGAFRAS